MIKYQYLHFPWKKIKAQWPQTGGPGGTEAQCGLTSLSRSDVCLQRFPTDRAYFIAKELLTTERTYVKDLEVVTVVSFFLTPPLLPFPPRGNEVEKNPLIIPVSRSAAVTAYHHHNNNNNHNCGAGRRRRDIIARTSFHLYSFTFRTAAAGNAFCICLAQGPEY